MAQVVWTKTARTQVEAIRRYIARFAPTAAERMARRLVEAGDTLAFLPERGRPARGGARELVVIRPYIIRYRVVDDVVLIVRVRHGARRPTS